jgi:hypothetical protein
MTQHQSCYDLFLSITEIVGESGNVKMINGVGYASVVATFRLDDTPSEIFNDVIGKVMTDSFYNKNTKITLEPDPDQSVFVKLVCSFKW